MRFYINGTEITFTNWNESSLMLSFSESDNKLSFSAGKVEIYGETKKIVNQWIDLKYGVGVNIPVQGIDGATTIDLYLDIKTIKRGTFMDEIELKIRKSNDHFWLAADGLTFNVVEAAGRFTSYNSVPYQIVAETSKLEKLILTTNTTLMAIQIVNGAFELGKLIADALDVVGTGVATAIAKAVVFAIWLAAEVALFINQTKQLIQIFAPPVRYLKSLSLYSLVVEGCAELGYQLQSSVLESMKKYDILPIPEYQPGFSTFKLFEFELVDVIHNYGYPRQGDSVHIFGRLIKWLLKMYNLELKVFNGTVIIERPEFFENNVSVKLSPMIADQENKQDVYGINTSDIRFYRRKFIGWSNDDNDKHTRDNSVYNVSEYLTQNINLPDDIKDLGIIGGMDEYIAPLALLRRKDGLFPVEKAIRDFLKLIDKAMHAFGSSSHFAQDFTDEHSGIGLISGQYFSVTKIIYNQGDGKQPENYMDYFNTNTIYETYHKSLEVQNIKTLRSARCPMTDGQFYGMGANNYVELTNINKVVKIIDCKYFGANTHKYADIVYQEDAPELGFNLETIKIY